MNSQYMNSLYNKCLKRTTMGLIAAHTWHLSVGLSAVVCSMNFLCTHVFLPIYTYVYVYMYICVCVHIHI